MKKKKPRIPHLLVAHAHATCSEYATRSPYDLCVISRCLFALNVGNGMAVGRKKKIKQMERRMQRENYRGVDDWMEWVKCDFTVYWNVFLKSRRRLLNMPTIFSHLTVSLLHSCRNCRWFLIIVLCLLSPVLSYRILCANEEWKKPFERRGVLFNIHITVGLFKYHTQVKKESKFLFVIWLLLGWMLVR